MNDRSDLLVGPKPTALTRGSASDRVGEDDALAVEGGEGGFGVAGACLGVAVLVVFDGLDQAL